MHNNQSTDEDIIKRLFQSKIKYYMYVLKLDCKEMMYWKNLWTWSKI